MVACRPSTIDISFKAKTASKLEKKTRRGTAAGKAKLGGKAAKKGKLKPQGELNKLARARVNTIMRLCNELSDLVEANSGQPASALVLWRGCADLNYHEGAQVGLVGKSHPTVEAPMIFALLPRRSQVRNTGGNMMTATAPDSVKHRFNKFHGVWKAAKTGADKTRLVVEPLSSPAPPEDPHP